MPKKYSGATGASNANGGGAFISERRSSVPKGSSNRGAKPTAAQPAGGDGKAVRGTTRSVSGLQGSNGSQATSGRSIKE